MTLEQSDRDLLARVDNRTIESLEATKHLRADVQELTRAWTEAQRRIVRLERGAAQLRARVTKLEGGVSEVAEDVEEITGQHRIELLEHQRNELAALVSKHEREAQVRHEERTWWTRWGADFAKAVVVAVATAALTYLVTHH